MNIISKPYYNLLKIYYKIINNVRHYYLINYKIYIYIYITKFDFLKIKYSH